MIAQMKDRGGRIKIPGFYDDVQAAAGGGAAGVGVAAVQREEVPEGLRHPEAARRDRLHDARADVGAADVRGQRPAVGVHRRGREDGAAGGGDGQDQHAARAEPGSEQDCRAVPEVRRGDRAEDRRAEGHAHARRQAVDDRRSTTRSCRPPAAPSRRASAGSRSSRAKADRFRWCRRSRRSSACRRCCSASGLPDENAHAPNEKLDLGNFHNGIIASAYLYDEIGRGDGKATAEDAEDAEV